MFMTCQGIAVAGLAQSRMLELFSSLKVNLEASADKDPNKTEFLGTGSATWDLEKVMEKGIQELGDPSEHPKIAMETARSLILSFKPS
jgi:hypothetical protein